MPAREEAIDVQGLDSDLLDCLDDNIAALLRHHNVADMRTPFAHQWFFDFPTQGLNADIEALPLPTLRRQSLDEMVAETTGFHLGSPTVHSGDEVRFCADLQSEGTPVIVQGDAYLMPWLPYYGRQHMNHSFIVEAVDDGLLRVADAYYNKTPWGEATPTRTTLPAEALGPLAESAMAAGDAPFLVLERWREPDPLDTPRMLRRNAEDILHQLGERHLLTEFSRFYATEITRYGVAERFTLACWLVARARVLHGRWLNDLAAGPDPSVDAALVESFTEQVAQPWERAMQFSYVLGRRVAAGRAAPGATFELIEHQIEPAEVELARQFTELSTHAES